MFGNGDYAEQTKMIYDHFKSKGYDCIPDLMDRLSGTSETGMIIINPSKVEITSVTMITSDVMKAGKKYVKSIGKLKISDYIK